MNIANQISILIHHLYRLPRLLETQLDWTTLLEYLDRNTDPVFFSGNRIFITGVGKNASLAMKASETFASLGLPSGYLNTTHLSHGDFGFVGYRDSIIHLSRSGKTEEMLGAATHLRQIKNHVNQTLLTCQETGTFDDSDLHKVFDQIIYAGEVQEIDQHGLAPTTSTTVLLAILDLIGTHLSSIRRFSREEFLQFHPGGALGEMLRKEKA